METNRIEIIQGPPREEMNNVYRAGSQKDVPFEIQYGIKRTACINILEIQGVEEKHVKMLGEMHAGFFMYSQGWDSRSIEEKTELIKVNIFYTTNTRKGYIQKIPKPKEEPRVCPRCHGRKVDPHHYQDDCQRCGGTGEVYGSESDFVPYPFVD